MINDALPHFESEIQNGRSGPNTQTLSSVPEGGFTPLLSPFLRNQYTRLLQIRSTILRLMKEAAVEGQIETDGKSAYGVHQADAGSDAYERDFALGLLAHEHRALREVEESLKRIIAGNYGICEICQKKIPDERLEALPFTRFTVDCQERFEKKRSHSGKRQALDSHFETRRDESEAEDEPLPLG